jgi:hypothetical protein
VDTRYQRLTAYLNTADPVVRLETVESLASMHCNHYSTYDFVVTQGRSFRVSTFLGGADGNATTRAAGTPL